MIDELPTNLLYFGDNLTWLREQGKFPGNGERYTRIQILSAQNLTDGKQVCMPQRARSTTFARAQRERGEGVQGRLGGCREHLFCD